MHPLIEQKLPEITRICRLHHVHRLEVFGSAARATDFDAASSDADFLVEFLPEAKKGLETYFSLKQALEALLQRGVDLVEPGAVRNPYVLAGIIRARGRLCSVTAVRGGGMSRRPPGPSQSS